MAPAHRVLLLLEVQRGRLCEPPPSGVPLASETLENIGQVLKAARAASPPPRIIHVRHTGEPGDPDDKSRPGWNLVFPPEEGEFVIDKIKNNAFAGTKLSGLISDHAEVIVIGLQSDFCVRATCSAALGRGNEVLLIKGAHATYDRVEVWNGGMVTPACEIIEEIEQELEVSASI
jgi:nicotinamidase-related amidase